MKLLNLLFLLIFSFSSIAQTVTEIGTDIVQVGDQSSYNTKAIVFDTGDDTANKKIEIDPVSKKIGINSAIDVEAIKSLGKMYVGEEGGYISWDNISNKLVYSNDGSLEKKIGSGSGSGSGLGENILENSSFEDLLTGWEKSVGGGTLTRYPYLSRSENDEYYVYFEGSDLDYFESSWKQIPSYFKGDCSFHLDNKSLVDFKFFIFKNNVANIVLQGDIESSADDWVRLKNYNFPCDPDAEYKIRFQPKSYGAIRADKIFLGSNDSIIKTYDEKPVGTIVSSMLTEAEFQGEVGAHWVLADGRDVTGSRYAQLKGISTVPDLRGVFIRGKNNGSDKDDERNLGGYQDDAFQGHRHLFRNATSSTGGSQNVPVASTTASGSSNAGTQNILDPVADLTNGSPRTANETRPKNVTVNFFIKINGKSIQAVTDVGYALRAGQIITGGFSTCPIGTLSPDGSEYDGLKYPHLWQAYGTRYGTGSASYRGKLPDYRGMFFRVHNDGSTVDPDSNSRTAMAPGGVSGDNVGSVQEDSLKSHSHSVGGNINYGVSNSAFAFTQGGATSTRNTNTFGGGETRPKNTYIKACIQAVNTDITGTFRQIDEFEERLRKSGSILVKREQTDNGWFEIYSDGWVRQNVKGVSQSTSGGTNVQQTINLAFAMKDTSYEVTPNKTGGDVAIVISSGNPISTTSAQASFRHAGSVAGNIVPRILVEGYGASSILESHGVFVDY